MFETALTRDTDIFFALAPGKKPAWKMETMCKEECQVYSVHVQNIYIYTHDVCILYVCGATMYIYIYIALASSFAPARSTKPAKNDVIFEALPKNYSVGNLQKPKTPFPHNMWWSIRA